MVQALASRARLLALLLAVLLFASACSSDTIDAVVDAVDPDESTFEDGEFDDDEFADDAGDDDADDEVDDEGLDGPEPDDVEAADDQSDAEYCPSNPDDASCDEWFDSLSDAEYCRVLPDDEFCAELADDEADDQADQDDQAEQSDQDDDAGEPESEGDDEPQVVTGPGSIATAGIDPSLTRDDGQCLPDDEAESDESGVEFNLAYQVVNGELGAVCFGSPDETVEGAWKVLADLVPPGQLRDLAVFAGFSSAETEGVTLAFVQRLDDDGTQFLMAVNIAETQADPDEATLTMAHEFTHVFTALPGEIDRFIEPEDCTTFDNGEGCYRDDSILNEWFQTFWPNAPGDPTAEAEGEQRCSLDAGFFGSYAASTPEEDFAEAFSAYVLRVEAKTDGQQQRLDWIDRQPGLREYRDRAIALGYGPQAHNFDRCG